MKKLFLIIISFIICDSLSCAENYAFLNSVDSVLAIIDTVKWKDGVVVDSHTSCMEFEKSNGYKGRMIKNKIVINELCRLFRHLEATSPKKIKTKSKFYFFSSDTIIATACIDVKYCLVDGDMYVTSPAIISYINDIRDFGEERIWYGQKSRQDVMEKGKEYIDNFIETHIDKNSTMRIRGYCHADAMGNVVFVKIVNGKDLPVSQDSLSELEKIIIKHVKWNINKERNIADMLPFSILTNKNFK